MTSKACPIPGCDRRCSIDYLFCKGHWLAVPLAIRRAVWATWNRGRPTPDYPTAVASAYEAAQSSPIT